MQLIVVVVLSATPCALAQREVRTRSATSVFPGSQWEEATPQSQGVDSAKLREAVELLSGTVGADGARELVIIRHGRMIWKGDNIDHRHGVWSATKSFTSTALGLLIADGKCTLDTRVADVLPDLHANYADVTLRHFTTMTSGYRAMGDETTGSYKHGPSSTPFVPNSQPLFTPPGSQFAYWDSAMNTLGLALTELANEPMEELFKRRVAQPIGMVDWDWGDLGIVDGLVVNGGSGNHDKHIVTTAREMARFGLLFLNNGTWNGRSIVPETWVREATRVHVPATMPWAHPESDIDGRGCYGCNWWRNGLKWDGMRKFPAAPEEMFWAAGHNNNLCFVIPEWDMVIVRLGLDGKAQDGVWNAFLEQVGQAVSSGSGDSPVAKESFGDGTVSISGRPQQWHKVTLTLDGPFAHERDSDPNPFTDYALNVTFTHESGAPRYRVPGYFAADGNAANSGADSGTKWRAHLSPDIPGRWSYAISFKRGPHAALEGGGTACAPLDGRTGEFTVAPTDKTGRDFRGKGRLQYVGKHHRRFAGSQEFFLKAGPDAPETLLAYADFDGTQPGRQRQSRPGEAIPMASLKTWQSHIPDWRPSDPTWRDGRGKGLIGALNYLAAKGLNTFSFLPYNAGGDGDNVWPFVARDDKLHYDCSKLEQWGIVFDHATALGLHLHFKLQENELDDQRIGDQRKVERIPEALDGGALGPERKLYCRELIARFGHAMALTWNLGEENTQSTDEQLAMADFIHNTDAYQHHIVVHTFPGEQDKVYRPLLDQRAPLTGASLQNDWHQVHDRTLHWVSESHKTGRPWVVANDEQGPASLGVPPDPGYAGHSGIATERDRSYTLHDIRQLTLWGNLMAGGEGVEYYFGYQLPQNDLGCEDWRSRDRSWDYCRLALEFFRAENVPFWQMQNADALIGNGTGTKVKYCLAKPGELYLVYLAHGGTTQLDLSDARGHFSVTWFNPRVGGELSQGSVTSVSGGQIVQLGQPPADVDEDWLAVVRKQSQSTDVAGGQPGRKSVGKDGTQLGIKGTSFTLDGMPTFLLGISYYGALGASDESVKRDLADIRKSGLNWIRIWATWSSGSDISAVDADGRPRAEFLERLQRLVATCDQHGIVVDVTLSRGINIGEGRTSLDSLRAHRRAVETIVGALREHRNWYLDLGNERNIMDKRFVPFADLKELRELVRTLDPSRLVTASQGGDISQDELGDYLRVAEVDFICPHRPRGAESPAETDEKTREYLAWMRDLGRQVPVHYQEPFRRGYSNWQPTAQDFVADLRGARIGGAAGWCFHNGDNRAANDGKPHRSFDLREHRLFEQLDEEEVKAISLLQRAD
jgi:CubicO group peptidase (beta-lactamase class C family)